MEVILYIVVPEEVLPLTQYHRRKLKRSKFSKHNINIAAANNRSDTTKTISYN